MASYRLKEFTLPGKESVKISCLDETSSEHKELLKKRLANNNLCFRDEIDMLSPRTKFTELVRLMKGESTTGEKIEKAVVAAGSTAASSAAATAASAAAANAAMAAAANGAAATAAAASGGASLAATAAASAATTASVTAAGGTMGAVTGAVGSTAAAAAAFSPVGLAVASAAVVVGGVGWGVYKFFKKPGLVAADKDHLRVSLKCHMAKEGDNYACYKLEMLSEGRFLP